jgi:chromosomal replication initiation ATPase DnaA
MNSIDSLLSLIDLRDHKKALIAMRPMLMPDARNGVDLLLAKFVNDEKNIESIFARICQCVSIYTGVMDIAQTTSRRRHEVLARQMVIYCLCAELVSTKRITLMQVGAFFANKYNHALIIHCRKNIRDLYVTDKDLRNTMDEISHCLYLTDLINTKICVKSIAL